MFLSAYSLPFFKYCTDFLETRSNVNYCTVSSRLGANETLEYNPPATTSWCNMGIAYEREGGGNITATRHRQW